MHIYYLLGLISIFLYLNVLCNGWNFCLNNNKGKDYCKMPSKTKHLACYPESFKRPSDQKSETLFRICPNTRKIRDLFLAVHNNARDLIASGNLRNDNKSFSYPSAERMRELVWDKELAYTAYLHVQYCAFGHDECHGTKKYNLSGQNVSVLYTKRSNRTMTYIIQDAMNGWMEEANFTTTVDVIDSMNGKLVINPEKMITHFTLLANDQVSKVGCAATHCTRDGKDNNAYHVTCNYDFSNINSMYVYVKGKESATNCKHWKTEKSSTYKHLCANSGEDFPMKIRK